MKALLLAALLLVSVLALVPAVDASPGGEPNCLQVYRETNLGPVRIVQRDSCHSEYYLCDRTPGDALAATNPLDCLIG